jgi:GNAT superfamily N-acetyltransferase
VAIRADEWLGAILGCPAFAVDGAADAVGLESAFLYAKVAADGPEDVAALEDVGFRVVDANVTLVRDTEEQATVDVAIDVSPLRAGETDAVLDIAESCFRYSRFHLDPQLPSAVADRIKREWVASYVTGRRGVELLVARVGVPIGFLAVLADGDARVIDLVGVAPDRQGAGAGAALVSAFVERHRRTAGTLRVGTQIANVPSLRLYSRFGFRVEQGRYVLHRHPQATP